ncbi:hypothetical protein BDZ97DRAFT_1805803 [Flammula alnicola]|nr:hypothetical protein BDZ97DRAFT_1805803 [Flammula alnicola]
MPWQAIDACVTVFCVSISAFLYNSRSSAGWKAQSYLLHNQVTHARLLPEESANAFTYPTLTLLVSLDALERRTLDLGRGWVITGLRPEPYLTKQPGTIRSKLDNILRTRGFLDATHVLQDAWMMTMPSFLGFEGINPLTVYFCYDSTGTFWLTVLEIHNTFGESHVHVLEVGQNEDETPSNGYDHQWTFRREFHVSPFNDRSGFYTVSIKSPSHPPMPSDILNNKFPVPPKPSVRVHLYTASEEDPAKRGLLKLTALLRPTHAAPLTTLSLLLALAQAPFALFLSLPRILFVAWILHYKKRLDVYLRPEPMPAANNWSPDGKPVHAPAGGVRWLDEGLLERFARHRVESFLRRRCQETDIEVTLVPADPSALRQTFLPVRPTTSRLTVSYLSSRFFMILFLTPSAKHALLLACDTEHIFQTSSKDLFLDVFSTTSTSKTKFTNTQWLQRLRCQGLPSSLSLSVPAVHYLDEEKTIRSALVIYIMHFLDWLEEWLFRVVRARIVEGHEPWKQWDRAAVIMQGDSSSTATFPRRDPFGSVRHDA